VKKKKQQNSASTYAVLAAIPDDLCQTYLEKVKLTIFFYDPI